ncbi:MAG: squalene--hopene cyclase [Gammaproteobacteria bacterium]|nr:squalene--hopene cyclase [Gammaproteobacteria bacterium]
MNEHAQTAAGLNLLKTDAVAPEFLREAAVHPLRSAVSELTATINRAGDALLLRQDATGYWRFDLEADTTIPAEYILFQHFIGTVNHGRHLRMAEYIRGRQLPSGAWPLYEAGPGNVSATVKAYFALKVTGDPPSAPHMQCAREWILRNGGAEASNVFTRILLATFGQVPWHTVPAMPVEMMLLPSRFYFNLSKVSYWSRCVIVPLLVLFAHRPVHRFPAALGISELFHSDPAALKHIDTFARGWSKKSRIKNFFIAIDRTLKFAEPLTPAFVRRYALAKAVAWMRSHMRGEGGIGAIYPAMANAVMALKVIGAEADDADYVRGVQAIEDLVLEQGEQAYCQPCVSPIWDTCLSINALTEAGLAPSDARIRSAVQWLFDKQIFVRGDWTDKAPDLDSGGWAFQFENDFYPDVDDTSMVLMALLRARAHEDPDHRHRIAMAVNWVLGMQNRDGGWGAFDIDNSNEYLNNIPFADHGALVDPSTSDLTARCIEVLAMLGYDKSFPPIARALEFLRREQEPSGAWYGRWGVNYIYGTWSVLCALGALGEEPSEPYIRKAVQWVRDRQNPDGGWGESCNTYDDRSLEGRGVSTASQTAWALLGLLAVDEVGSETVERGVQYLLRTRNHEGTWNEPEFTGTGFPRVFYLRYHGYCHYFPLWALGAYRRIRHGLPTAQSAMRAAGPVNLGPLPAMHKYRYA